MAHFNKGHHAPRVGIHLNILEPSIRERPANLAAWLGQMGKKLPLKTYGKKRFTLEVNHHLKNGGSFWKIIDPD